MRRIVHKNGYYVLDTRVKRPKTVFCYGDKNAVDSLALLTLTSRSYAFRKMRFIFCCEDNVDLSEERESERLAVVEFVRGEPAQMCVGAISCGASRTEFFHSDAAGLLRCLQSAAESIDGRRTPTVVEPIDGGVAVETLYYDGDAFEKAVMCIANAAAPFCALVSVRYNYPPRFCESGEVSGMLRTVGELFPEVKTVERQEFKKQIWLPLSCERICYVRFEAEKFDLLEDQNGTA